MPRYPLNSTKRYLLVRRLLKAMDKLRDKGEKVKALVIRDRWNKIYS